MAIEPKSPTFFPNRMPPSRVEMIRLVDSINTEDANKLKSLAGSPALIVDRHGKVTSTQMLEVAHNVWRCGCYTIFQAGHIAILERHRKTPKKDGTGDKSSLYERWERNTVTDAATTAFHERFSRGLKDFKFSVVKSRHGHALDFSVYLNGPGVSLSGHPFIDLAPEESESVDAIRSELQSPVEFEV